MSVLPPLVVEATLTSLKAIEAYLAAVAADARLGERDAYRLHLAIDELATNIITHGYQENGLSGRIVVRARLVSDGVVIELEDDAPAFDPSARPMPGPGELATPIEDRQVGGLGVFLAFQHVDGFRYERRGSSNVSIVDVRRRPVDSGRPERMG